MPPVLQELELVITCQKCGKENQDHYKFCLGCGAELPRDAAPKPFAPQTPPQGMKAVASAAPANAVAVGAATAASPSGALGASGGAPGSAGAGAMRGPAASAPFFAPPSAAPGAAPGPAPVISSGAAAAVSAAATVICPQCSHANTPANLFCSSCGFRMTQASAKQPAVAAPAAAAPGPGAVVLTALRADGTEAGTYEVPNGGNASIGRDTGAIFASDSYLSPRHATFRQAGGKLFLKDEGSLNGVYKKLMRDVPVEVRLNDVFRIGQEIVRFEPLAPLPASPDGVERLGAPVKGFAGRLALITGRDTTGNSFLVPDVGMHMGRERGEVLFPEDGYVSGLHCRLAFEGTRMFLTDLGSSNGTFVRLREETEVKTGDVLLMGQQLFRVMA